MDLLKTEIKEEVYEIESVEENTLSSIKRESNIFGKNEEAEDLVTCSVHSSKDVGYENSDENYLLKRESLKSEEGILKNNNGMKVLVLRIKKKNVKPNKKRIRVKKKRVCSICQLNVLDLKSHMLTHTRQTPYKCKVCGEEFTHRNSLLRHRYAHTKERPHQCLICEKSFMESYQLKIHMNLHSDERTFKCNICNKQFMNKNDVRSHIADIHANRRDFKCGVCQKKFKRKEHLQKHLLIHIDEKPFACAECNKTFRSKWHLQKHIATHEARRLRRSKVKV